MGTDVERIVLDSPHNRNALSAGLVGNITDCLETAAGNEKVRCVVLTHTGGTFCAGADLAEAASEGGSDAGTRRLVKLLRTMITHPKPIIGIIDGHVRAGGLGLLGACDVVITGPTSTFALTESRLGLAPAIISLTLAAKVDPRAWARYALGGETFGPDEAARIGLVTLVDDEPERAGEEMIASYRLASPQGLAATKELVNGALLADFDTRADELTARSAALFASADAQEGIAAFKDRRQPRWVIG